jgi:DNA-directed RNA polymerase subunit RPC12/RpoP
MKEGTLHKCRSCKTKHYSDDEKVLVRDAWETWRLNYVCKNCGATQFSEEDITNDGNEPNNIYASR